MSGGIFEVMESTKAKLIWKFQGDEKTGNNFDMGLLAIYVLISTEFDVLTPA